MFTAPFSLPKTARPSVASTLTQAPNFAVPLIASSSPRCHPATTRGGGREEEPLTLARSHQVPEEKNQNKNIKEGKKEEPSRWVPAEYPRAPQHLPGREQSGGERGAQERVAGAEPEPAGAGRPPFSTRRAADSTGRAHRPDRRTDGRTDRPPDRPTDRARRSARPGPPPARPPRRPPAPFCCRGRGARFAAPRRRSPPRKDAGGRGRRTQPPGCVPARVTAGCGR